MDQFSKAGRQSSADFTERMSLPQLAEQHRDRLHLAGKGLGIAFALMLVHNPSKFGLRKQR
jgi:hypothetical protein